MNNSATKICQNCKVSFEIDASDFAFYEKIKVPPPTFCMECREIRRIAFRNERSLYKRNCDLCGNSVVSRVSPNKPYPMYCNKCWWSDKWNPLNYGKDYDFSRPFFEQFKELLFSTPHISLQSSNTINSEWVNQESDDKNCYLNVGGHFNEDSAYNTYEFNGRDCFDNWWILKGELCYENIHCERCYKVMFSRECFDCQDTLFSSDCRNCHHIFGCTGLRNKSYHIFNKPVSKEEYENFLKNNPISSSKNISRFINKAEEVRLKNPHRSNFIVKSVNVSGNFIHESKKSYNIWNAEKIENCKNIYLAIDMKDCYDISSVGWSELCYEGGHCGGIYKSKFFLYMFGGGSDVTARNAFNLEYCYSTIASNNCFGCANMKKGQYCILNKQYSKEEYEALVPRIKKQMEEMPYISRKSEILNPKSETNPKSQIQNSRTREIIYRYGEFFPPELSPFGYNETAAQDYYSLTREEAMEKGYVWSDYESQIKYEFSDYEIPDDIKDVKDDILDKILRCEVSGKAYKIIPIELQFYRKMGLPIPRRAPLQRHQDRINRLLPRKLFDRQCQCAGLTSNQQPTTKNIYTNTISHFHDSNHCPHKIQTPYAADRPEIIYCEDCYKSEIV